MILYYQFTKKKIDFDGFILNTINGYIGNKYVLSDKCLDSCVQTAS